MMYIVPFTTSGGASKPFVVPVEKVKLSPSLDTFAGVIWFSAEKRVCALSLPGVVQLPSSAGDAAAGGSARWALAGVVAISAAFREGSRLLQAMSAMAAVAGIASLRTAVLTRRITPPYCVAKGPEKRPEKPYRAAK